MSDETVLTLTGIGVPPYSARGLTQTLEPIEQAASLQRTINGVLHDLSPSAFRKYKSTITGSDQRPPACDGVWPGKLVEIDCIVELAYPEGGTPERAAVSGSSVEDNDGFVYYRPHLTMMVTSFKLSKDEYGAIIDWTMDLEEQ